MKIRHILIIVTAILIIILLGISSYISYNIGIDYGEKNAEEIRLQRTNNIEENDQIKLEKHIEVIKVTSEFNQQIIESSGRVSSLQNITISSEVQGKLEGRFSLKKGRKFKKRDVLFEIKDSDISLLLQARKSGFMNLISANLADIKLDFPNEYDKWELFFNSISINSSLPELPETNTSQEKNFIVSKSILSEYLAIKADEERLKKYTVRAPFDGSITESYTDLGSIVNPGSPVIDIIKDGSMEIELPINKSDINSISIGDEVELKDGDLTFHAKITRIGDFIDNQTQNISVFAKIEYNNNIYSGMYLDATITTNGKIETFNIPRRAIFGNNNIYIITENNKLEKREIEIHSSNNNTVNIIGIDENTIIVSEPIINAKEGMIVNPRFSK